MTHITVHLFRIEIINYQVYMCVCALTFMDALSVAFGMCGGDGSNRQPSVCEDEVSFSIIGIGNGGGGVLFQP